MLEGFFLQRFYIPFLPHMQQSNLDWNQLVTRLIDYKNQANTPYIKKFDKDWISNIITELGEIMILEKKFYELGDGKVDIFGFVRVFLNLLPHTEEETIFLTVALMDLFKNICDTYLLEKYVKSSDVLNYIIEVTILMEKRFILIELFE